MLTGGISAVKIVRSWKMTSAEALETGVLAGRPEWDGNELQKLTPANAVTGVVEIDGRRTIVHGGDFIGARHDGPIFMAKGERR